MAKKTRDMENEIELQEVASLSSENNENNLQNAQENIVKVSEEIITPNFDEKSEIEQEEENKSKRKSKNKKTKADEEFNIEIKDNETDEEKQHRKAEEQKKKLDEAEQNVANMNSKKKKIMNLCFFILNIAIVIGILIYQLGGQKIETIKGLKLNGFAILLLIFLFVAYQSLEVFAGSYLLKASTGKWRPILMFKVYGVGRYYDSITPMATGGQPFQITYLKNHGESLHTALSIPVAKYLFSQIAIVIVSLTCLIISSVDSTYNSYVSIASVIGFICSSVVLSVAIFLSVSKTVGRKIVVKVLKLLYKMKIIKNYDKQYVKITKYIEDFQSVMQQYAKSPKDFIIMLATNLLRFILYYSIPYGIFALMRGFDSSMYIKFIVMGVLVDLASSFFPLPGGTGMNEISFSAMFAPFFANSLMTVWALLIWRFFSYYYFLILGISIISYDVAYGNRKYKWQVKKDNLVEESKVFKQMQIDKFRAERSKRRYVSQRKKSIKANK